MDEQSEEPHAGVVELVDPGDGQDNPRTLRLGGFDFQGQSEFSNSWK